MTKQFLKLLYRHSFLNSHGGHGSAEFMRMNMVHMRPVSQFCQKAFYSGDRKALPGGIETDKERVIIVTAPCQILLKVDFCFGVKINPALFISLAKHDTLSAGKIDIGTIEINKLSDTDSRRYQNIYNSQISGIAALIPQAFKVFIRQRFPYNLRCLNFVDTADRAFDNIVFILQPDKK